MSHRGLKQDTYVMTYRVTISTEVVVGQSLRAPKCWMRKTHHQGGFTCTLETRQAYVCPVVLTGLWKV